MADIEALMKRCQIGVPRGPDAYDDLHNILAECYGTLGKLRAQVAALRAIIASDSWAITFQTMGQYRTALLRTIDGASEQRADTDCTPNHLCKGRMVHLPRGEQCDRCGHE